MASDEGILKSIGDEERESRAAGNIPRIEIMEDELSRNRKALVVGGTFDVDHNLPGVTVGKPSKIAAELADCLGAEIINGGSVSDLADIVLGGALTGFGLVVWIANVPNEHDKAYPKKDRGAILIVSKVMRESYTRMDALKRVFDMHGNAVIEIHAGSPRWGTDDPKQVEEDLAVYHGLKKPPMDFKLVDALGNEWVDTRKVDDLAAAIQAIADWTAGSVRVASRRAFQPALERLMGVSKSIADSVEAGTSARYFGNVSTRCMSMFPSLRLRDDEDGDIRIRALMSPRHTDKRRLEASDMVLVEQAMDRSVMYVSDRKPSVDSAAHLEIYAKTPVNFMVHGHAYVEWAPFTANYFPCGDLREVNELLPLIDKLDNCGAINIKHHGFLLFAETIEDMERIVAEEAVFLARGDEKVSHG